MQSVLVFLLLFVFWLVVAPGCMTFRKADKEMIRRFQQQGVQLHTATQRVEGRNIHYAATGKDSLPTIVFIHGTPGSWDAFAGYMQDSSLLTQYRMISIDRPGSGYSDFGKPEHLIRQSELDQSCIGEIRQWQTDVPRWPFTRRSTHHSARQPTIPLLVQALVMISDQ